MNKLVFVIGMRRSGTSILQKLILSHTEVDSYLFEPHNFLYALKVYKLYRYHKDKYVLDSINEIQKMSLGEKLSVIKFAFNPGIDAMNWKEIKLLLPDAKFVFITRDPKKTYDSWCRVETAVRGTCSYDLYLPWWEFITNSFDADASCHIRYENLLEDADKEMSKVWDLLGVENINGLNKRIIKK